MRALVGRGFVFCLLSFFFCLLSFVVVGALRLAIKAKGKMKPKLKLKFKISCVKGKLSWR